VTACSSIGEFNALTYLRILQPLAMELCGELGISCLGGEGCVCGLGGISTVGDLDLGITAGDRAEGLISLLGCLGIRAATLGECL
jgi:hypothetical protein